MQDSTNELVLIQMNVNSIHGLQLCNGTCETFVLRKMVCDDDSLYSTIWLSLPHIGKANIKTLPRQQQALSFFPPGDRYSSKSIDWFVLLGNHKL